MNRRLLYALLVGLALPLLWGGTAQARAGRLVLMVVPGLTLADVLDHDPLNNVLSASATLGLLPAQHDTLSPLATIAAMETTTCGLPAHLSQHSEKNAAFAQRLWGSPLEENEAFLANQAPLLEQCSPHMGRLATALSDTGVETAFLADTTCLSPHPEAALLAANERGHISHVHTGDAFTLPAADAPCGHRLHRAALLQAMEEALQGHRLVVMQVGTLARLSQETPFMAAPRRTPARVQALERLGTLFAEITDTLGGRADVLVIAPATTPSPVLGWGPDFRKGGLLSVSGYPAGVLSPLTITALVLDLFALSPREAFGLTPPAMPLPEQRTARTVLTALRHHGEQRTALDALLPPWLSGLWCAGLLLMLLMSFGSASARGVVVVSNLAAVLLGTLVTTTAIAPVGGLLGQWGWLGLSAGVATAALAMGLMALRRLGGAFVLLGLLAAAVALVDTLTDRSLSAFAPVLWPPTPLETPLTHPLLAGAALGGLVCATAGPAGDEGTPGALVPLAAGLWLVLLGTLAPPPLGNQPHLAAAGTMVAIAVLLGRSRRVAGPGEWLLLATLGLTLLAIAWRQWGEPTLPLAGNLALMSQPPWSPLWGALGLSWLTVLGRQRDLSRLAATHRALVSGALASLLGALACVVWVPGGALSGAALSLLPTGMLLSALPGIGKASGER